MEAFQHNLEKYAALAVEVGVNVQPGQMLVVSAPIQAAAYVRSIVKHAYEVGARYVHVDWTDDAITRTRFELAPEDSFAEYPIMWRAKGWEEMAENNAAFLSVISANPDLLQGIDPRRVKADNIARSNALQHYRAYAMSDKISWSIVAIPSQVWADKVFPSLDADARVDALWEAIFKATRIDRNDPVQAWKEHTATLDTKADHLNKRKYKALHYQAPGTDLTIELPPLHHWVSAGSVNSKGTTFVANMPTEEVFTAPLKTGVNGTVKSTKPLSYAGNLIEHFSLTFKEGQIVDYKAESGYETLKNLIETDDGSRYLGEVALVPHQSPISQTDLIFYNTLFDENASNHLAIGKAYAFCLEGGKAMSKEEQIEQGLNDSLTHVDFMIGSAEMDIDGILADGTREPVFRKGNWAF
ncbi:aminopeptidase [Xylanibacillus composti]|uniref:Aminopeptidase n=1 Tax=Xylanibacillus composti TaxID=1572762 RepID=A0A8J4M0L5_9BACL|nr:aminopeptidase [Xylanibacillus composti]MDT9726797.1 aminopeptidase [Xylanibacillus composti]GIQ67220.1 aminopeptidase [Xylanibacillus composti]